MADCGNRSAGDKVFLIKHAEFCIGVSDVNSEKHLILYKNRSVGLNLVDKICRR
jgi:hypothetical protein